MAAKDILETSIARAFEAMNTMSEGGNAYLAKQIAAAVDVYSKSLGIPPGAVITAVSGGSGAPAVGLPNTSPISLTG
jgi:hypothetical protein